MSIVMQRWEHSMKWWSQWKQFRWQIYDEQILIWKHLLFIGKTNDFVSFNTIELLDCQTSVTMEVTFFEMKKLFDRSNLIGPIILCDIRIKIMLWQFQWKWDESTSIIICKLFANSQTPCTKFASCEKVQSMKQKIYMWFYAIDNSHIIQFYSKCQMMKNGNYCYSL